MSLSQLCESISQLCESISQLCESISQLCESISQLCESISQLCESISQLCESISQLCESISQLCESISQFCESISQLCESISQLCESITKLYESTSSSRSDPLVLLFFMKLSFSHCLGCPDKPKHLPHSPPSLPWVGQTDFTSKPEWLLQLTLALPPCLVSQGIHLPSHRSSWAL